MLAVARLDGFAALGDDGGMDETHDRAEAVRLKLASRRDSRRRVPEGLRAEAVAFAKAERKALQVDRVGTRRERGDVDAVVPP